MSLKSWKDTLDFDNGEHQEPSDLTLTRTLDSRVHGADEVYLVTSTGIDGPDSTPDTVRGVSMLLRKGSVRLKIKALAGSRLPSFEDVALEAPLDERVASVIVQKNF